MPKVEQFGASKVSTQVTQGPRAQVLPAAAFATGLEGVGALGKGLTDLGARMDTTAAEEALVGFEKAKNDMFFNPESGYFNTQGRNAFDAAKGTSDALTELQREFSDKLSSNGAKSLFSRASNQHVSRANADILRHSSKGLRAWEVNTLNAQVENTLENSTLYWNDPQQLGVQNALGRQAVLDAAQLQGVGPEATNERLQTYDSAFTKGAIESATLSSAAQGQALLDQAGDKLEGPDRVLMQKAIAAKEQAEKVQSDAQMAVLTAKRLNDQYDSRSDIIAEVEKIEDLELRKKTKTEAMQRFSQNKQAESEARAASYEGAETHIINGGTAESYKAVNPESWERLSAKQQKTIQAGTVAVTDWNKFSELMVLPKDQLAKIDPTDHFSDLAPAERSKLITAVKTANGSSADKADNQVGRSRTAQTSAAVEQVFGPKSKWNDTKRVQANGFYDLIDSEVRYREGIKNAKLTSEEYTAVLGDMTRKVTVEGGLFRLGIDFELDITDIPAEDVPSLSKFLRDNGVPVTSDNLIKAFQQATE